MVDYIETVSLSLEKRLFVVEMERKKVAVMLPVYKNDSPALQFPA